MLFIRHLDNQPEALFASALADAEARGLDDVCVFFSHVAEPELLRSALKHARVSGVGTKDRFPQTLLPEELRADSRIGRSWEPGEWCVPARATNVYFVGPRRLLTWRMLREATRCGTASLRCRVATSWVPVPLSFIRAGIAARSIRKAALIRATFFIRHL